MYQKVKHVHIFSIDNGSASDHLFHIPLSIFLRAYFFKLWQTEDVNEREKSLLHTHTTATTAHTQKTSHFSLIIYDYYLTYEIYTVRQTNSSHLDIPINTLIHTDRRIRVEKTTAAAAVNNISSDLNIFFLARQVIQFLGTFKDLL